jgi:hypothetical protein
MGAGAGAGAEPTGFLFGICILDKGITKGLQNQRADASVCTCSAPEARCAEARSRRGSIPGRKGRSSLDTVRYVKELCAIKSARSAITRRILLQKECYAFGTMARNTISHATQFETLE